MNILIASPIFSDTIQELRKQNDVVCAYKASEEELSALMRDREVLIFRSGVQITANVMSGASQLKLILRAGSGIDNIDLDYVNRHGIELVRIPLPGAKAVAEMAFAFMLSLSRNVLEADRLLREGKWAKHELTGYAIGGKVLGILGAGNIGSLVGQLGAAWGMEVVGCVELPSAARTEELRKKGIRLTDVHEVLRISDIVSIHLPLHSSTRNLINAQALATMKAGAFLVNLARGGVVDEFALYNALASGHLRGAALDVHAAEGDGKFSPLANLKNTILTPHIGAGTFDSQREIGEIILDRINSFSAIGQAV